MSEAPSIDRDDAMLARLAELDLALAEKTHAAALAAEAPADIAELSRAYQRVARSLRQTLALRAQLKRQRAQDLRDHPPPPPKRDLVRMRRRMEELRDAVERVAWNEGEADDWVMGMLDEHLIEVFEAPDFGLAPLDDDVALACAELGLSADLAARWRDLPAVPADVPPDAEAPPTPDTSLDTS